MGRWAGGQVDTLCVPCCLQAIVEAGILLASNRLLLATWLPSRLVGGCVGGRAGGCVGAAHWVGMYAFCCVDTDKESAASPVRHGWSLLAVKCCRDSCLSKKMAGSGTWVLCSVHAFTSHSVLVTGGRGVELGLTSASNLARTMSFSPA